MLPARAIKERDKRENNYGDKKKSMAINSDLGEIFDAKQKQAARKLYISTPPGNDINNLRPVLLSRGNIESLG